MTTSRPYLKSAARLVAFGLVVASGSLQAAPDLSKLPPASDKTGLTYSKDIRPLFEASCFRCHGEQRPRGGLRLDSLEAALTGGDSGKVINPGHSQDSLLVVAVARLDEETAMPPQRPGQFGGGPPGGGFGGFGGRGGGAATSVATQLVSQGDRNGDKKLSADEFSAVAEVWFDKLDTDRAGQLSEEEFTERFPGLLPPSLAGARGFGGFGGGGQRGGDEMLEMFGTGVFKATDKNTNGILTKSEFKGVFVAWYGQWDTNHVGALSEEQIRTGLNAAQPRQNPFAGFAGFGGGRGPAGTNGPGIGRVPGATGGAMGPGGPGGFGGFGFGRGMLAQIMVSQGDQDKDAKLSKAEMSALADAWFDRLDTERAGKLSQKQFTDKLGEVVGLTSGPGAAPTAGLGGQLGGPDAAGGPTGYVGTGLFAVADTDKDGFVTRSELKVTFEKWFVAWDSEKSGALSEEKLYAGLSAALPRPAFGGFGGGGAPGGGGGRGAGGPGGAGGFGGGAGPAPPPLTAQQVGLIRAWIDQGAH